MQGGAYESTQLVKWSTEFLSTFLVLPLHPIGQARVLSLSSWSN